MQNAARPKRKSILPLFLACVALLPVTIGCASTSVVKGTTLADVRQGKGAGSTRTYEAPFDAVWDAMPKVIHELGLAVAGDNKQEGYVLAERDTAGEKVAIFTEPADATHTRVEVISRKAWVAESDDNFPNWEPQIIANLDRKLKDPSWESRWIRKDFYLSLQVDFGTRDIPVVVQTTAGEGLQNQSFYGGTLSLVTGYDINRALGVEIGLGYSDYSFSSCDQCLLPADLSGDFRSSPLTASLIYHFYRPPGYPPAEFHLGWGIEYHMSPTLEITQRGGGFIGGFTSRTTTVRYHDAVGNHVGIGGSWGARYVFFFDVKYVFGLKFRARESSVDGAASAGATLLERQELDGSGALLGIGFGYHF